MHPGTNRQRHAPKPNAQSACLIRSLRWLENIPSLHPRWTPSTPSQPCCTRQQHEAQFRLLPSNQRPSDPTLCSHPAHSTGSAPLPPPLSAVRLTHHTSLKPSYPSYPPTSPSLFIVLLLSGGGSCTAAGLYRFATFKPESIAPPSPHLTVPSLYCSSQAEGLVQPPVCTALQPSSRSPSALTRSN